MTDKPNSGALVPRTRDDINALKVSILLPLYIKKSLPISMHSPTMEPMTVSLLVLDPLFVLGLLSP
jgi:hypothetical protein